ncbi:MAG: hypothetical protein HFG48_00230 [Bacilli bacterium]|nr:hypothetical protein [Bacilli bacterium]
MKFLGLKSYSTKAICIIDEQLRKKLDIYQELFINKIRRGLDTKVEESEIAKLESDIEFLKLVLIDKYKQEDMKLHTITSMLKRSYGSNYLALQKVLVHNLTTKNELADLQTLITVINDLPIDDIVTLANLTNNQTVKTVAEEIAHEYQESRYEEIEKTLSAELKAKILDDNKEFAKEERRNKYVKYKR